MSMLNQLKHFCKTNELDFPKFKPVYTNDCVKYQVEWYSRIIYASEWFSTDDEALKNCAIYLSEWVKNEKNYLNLLDYENSAKMDIV